MSLHRIFEHLQEYKMLAVALETPVQAENLRIMLTKKWSKYKKGLEDLGFLDSDTRHLSISMESGKVLEDGTQEFVFHLRPRSRSRVEYKILTILETNRES